MISNAALDKSYFVSLFLIRFHVNAYTHSHIRTEIVLHMCAYSSLHRVELFPSRHICASASAFCLCLLFLANRPWTRNDHAMKDFFFFLRRDAMYDHWLYGAQCSVFCWRKGQRAPQKPLTQFEAINQLAEEPLWA